MCINSLLPLIPPTSTIQHTLLLHSGVFLKTRETHLIAASSDFVYLRSSLWDIGPHVKTGAIRPNFAATTICFPTFLWFYRTFALPSNRSIFISGLYVFIPHNSRSPSTPAFHVYYVILTYDDISTFAQVVPQYPCKLYTNTYDTASYDFLHIGLQFSACRLETILIKRYENFINSNSNFEFIPLV